VRLSLVTILLLHDIGNGTYLLSYEMVISSPAVLLDGCRGASMLMENGPKRGVLSTYSKAILKLLDLVTLLHIG
jgi:hypothetical protein